MFPAKGEGKDRKKRVTCVGLHALPGLSVQGFSSAPNSVLCGQQQRSSQSSSQPQSHSSPSSTTPLPHSAALGSLKHPATAPLALAVSTYNVRAEKDIEKLQ